MLHPAQVNRSKPSAAEQREGRVLLMVVSMVTGYVLCWMPYGVVAILSSYGQPFSLPPAASLVPALLAKTSTVLNPFIYVLLNDQVGQRHRQCMQILTGHHVLTQFSRCLLYMIRCGPEDQPGGDHQTLASSGVVAPRTEGSLSDNTWPNMFLSLDQQEEPLPSQEGNLKSVQAQQASVWNHI